MRGDAASRLEGLAVKLEALEQDVATVHDQIGDLASHSKVAWSTNGAVRGLWVALGEGGGAWVIYSRASLC